MTDLQFEELKGKLLAYAELWMPRLGLANWRIKFVFERDRAANGAAGTANGAWEYRQGCVTFFMLNVANDSDDEQELEWTVVHELLHLAMWAIWPDTTEEGDSSVKPAELAVTHMADVMVRAYGYMKPEEEVAA